MASETKIGLLVGLTFIISFSVILANRGQRSGLNAQLSYAMLVDRAQPETLAPAPPGGPRQPATADRPASVSGQPVAEAEPAPRVTPHQIDPVPPPRVDQPLQLPPAWFGEDTPAAGREVASGTATDVAETAAGGDGNPRAGRARLTALPEDPTRRAEVLQAYLDDLYASMRRDDGAGHTPKAGDTAPPAVSDGDPPAVHGSWQDHRAPAPTPLTYTVVKGDTLSAIAKKFYDSNATEIVEAIYAANRSVMPSPDRLNVGDELVLPAVPGFAGPGGVQARPAGSPRTAPPRVDAPSRAPADRAAGAQQRQMAFRWYQVRQNDRYITIAREQLGDASRWREIYELNKDKFPDPARIRTGVRIKIPADRLARADE